MMKGQKKKLKFLTSIPIIIGVFIIIYASLGMVYFNRHSQSGDLASQITLKRTILQKPQPNVKELNTQLKEAEAELEAIQTSLPNPGQGIDIYGALVDLGRKLNINILNIVASSPIPPKDSEGGPTLPYSLTIKGSQDDTLAFISSLIQSTELLQGLELQNINIQSGATSDDPDTVDLRLYIHTWPDLTSGGQDIGQTSGSKK
jgi:Tfp pilus assembly protein PilO